MIKADGQGSVEALRSRVESLSNGEVGIRVILAGVGGITPNDVNLASASNAVPIGFNIRPDETVKRLAENEQVDLRFYQVIYDVENDLKKAMVGLLAPKSREIVLGRAAHVHGARPRRPREDIARPRPESAVHVFRRAGRLQCARECDGATGAHLTRISRAIRARWQPARRTGLD